MNHMDYMQLYYEVRFELEQIEEHSEVVKEIVAMMYDMEDRLKGGPEYK